MKHKLFLLLTSFLVLVLGASAVQADGTDTETELDLEEDYPWQGHAFPLDFKFGNMIDSHQQSHLDSNGLLHGFIYIYDTGEDTDEGYPIAEKAHCPTGPCMVGWVIKGAKINATLVNKSPRIWLVDPLDLPKEQGYFHFHWLGSPHSPGGPNGLVVGQEYEGYLMRRIAKTSFFWLGGPGQGGSGGGCGGGSGGEHEDGGCSGGGGDMGSEGGCSGDDHSDGGCTGDDHSDGGCSGGGGSDMGGGGSSHGGRLVNEGLDFHTNIVTVWDGTWHGDGCGD